MSSQFKKTEVLIRKILEVLTKLNIQLQSNTKGKSAALYRNENPARSLPGRSLCLPPSAGIVVSHQTLASPLWCAEKQSCQHLQNVMVLNFCH